MSMTPEQAIEKIDQLPKKLNQIMHSLSLECDSISEQWEGLKRVGGARADHAATLLSRLRPALADLARQGRAIELQINGWVADPFGTKELQPPAESRLVVVTCPVCGLPLNKCPEAPAHAAHV